MTGGTESSWRLVPSGVTAVTIVTNTHIFINDLDDETECTLCRSADDIKLGEMSNTSNGWMCSCSDLEYCVQVWPLQYKKRTLEQFQQRAMKIIKILQLRLKELELLSLKKKRFRGDLINVYKYLIEGMKKREPGFYQ